MRRLALAFLILTASGAVLAQAPWPTKNVRMIVTLTPGSTTDIVARSVADRLSARLGQPVIVENRPGASGTVAAAAVVRAEPDGYTLLVASSAHTVAPFLYTSLAYDTARDLAGVAPLANLPTVLVAPAGRYRSVHDLVAAGRAKPGTINFGSAAASTQLNAERFRRSAGFEGVHVPFKGAPEAIAEVVAGRIDFYFAPIAPALGSIRDGRVAALAIGGSKRSSLLPEVPTTIEAGYPDSDYNFWVGMFAPAKTPRAVVERLHRETAAALATPELRERIAKIGGEPMPMTPEQFDAHVRDELRLNAQLVKAAGITAN